MQSVYSTPLTPANWTSQTMEKKNKFTFTQIGNLRYHSKKVPVKDDKIILLLQTYSKYSNNFPNSSTSSLNLFAVKKNSTLKNQNILPFLRDHRNTTFHVTTLNNNNNNNNKKTSFIIKGFRTIVFIFIAISTTFRPTRNFELRPLLNPLGSSVLIPLAITGYKC